MSLLETINWATAPEQMPFAVSALSILAGAHFSRANAARHYWGMSLALFAVLFLGFYRLSEFVATPPDGALFFVAVVYGVILVAVAFSANPPARKASQKTTAKKQPQVSKEMELLAALLNQRGGAK
jgi:Na+/proline symporter